MPPKINKPFKVREIGKKAVVGTRKGNKILNKKELIDALLEVSRKQMLMDYNDPQGRFRITKQMSFKSDGQHIQRNYVLEINGATGVKKYFIKEEKLSTIGKENLTSSYTWEDAITESKALNVISDYLKEHKESKIITVQFKFSYLDREKGVSYICYNFQEGHHPKTLLQRKQIGIKEYLDINRRLGVFEKRLNEYLAKNLKKYNLEEGTILTDISPENVFYDPKTKKIRIFNPVLSK